MKLFAISDPHLCLGKSHSMNHLGMEWHGHIEKIETGWKATVTEEDIVLISGDISWGETLHEAEPDLKLLDSLPGRKVLLNGNHDNWWQQADRIKSMSCPTLSFLLEGQPLLFEQMVITGVPLYVFPEIRWNVHAPNFDMVVMDSAGNPRSGFDEREKQHEQIRALETSLIRLPEPDGRKRIVMLHFPPVGPDRKSTHVSRIISEYEIDLCVFGHLHRVARDLEVAGVIDGVKYVLTSADYVNFRPRLLCEL